jgi:hypothetical protein
MLDAEDVIGSIDPEWRRPDGQHRARVRVRLGCGRRRGLRRATGAGYDGHKEP